MVVCTAALIFVLLVFAPIRIRVNVKIYFHKLKACINARIYRVKVFNETVLVRGVKLICDGTVKTEVNMMQINADNGVNLLKCVTIDSLSVSVLNNLSNVSAQAILAENIICALATRIACGVSCCRISSRVLACIEESNARIQIASSFSVAELSFCLLKQGVQLWMRKSAKS